ncbi:glutamate-cysteine ligase family protein [Tenacibaculum pacificus]|uniref:glutamate-cysteine ligase family protein n=1 Tax=Tenacibaculum pacificus TaxID=3018314 RepID=UPI0022F4015D|nr:glutamate-cysteine ligase family protein [Tenacibaculum pacificus]WBX73224.1 glutamate-cysteine ligase family protein [Tenacibaculum pacificus]
MKKQIVSDFKKSFNFDKNQSSRGIGIECEIPIVDKKGNAVSLPIVQQMFTYLASLGFELEKDKFSDLFIAAKKTNKKSSSKYKFCTDLITTDTGYSIIEVVLAPQNNLQAIESKLMDLLFLLTTFFENQNCFLLGYGIQPLTYPSRKMQMPQERYSFFEKFSTNNIIPKDKGTDSSFLNITASSQCHIEISADDAIKATNVLNAFSGLQIALHANSPIWGGAIDTKHKAKREMVWDFCFPDRLNQIGIPPVFDSKEMYIEYLLNFKPLVVKRNKQYYKILNKNTFNEFLENTTPTIGSSLAGKKETIKPHTDDIQQLIPFSWFNARLVPKYGTIESRMCCQQPLSEMLTPVALTLGLIENLEAAKKLMEKYPIEKWRDIRNNTAQNTLNTFIDGESIIPLVLQLVNIANEGLKKRNLQEEIFLKPLYKRIKERKSPADLAIQIFKNKGINGLIEYTSFNKEAFSPKHQNLYKNTLKSVINND